MEDLTEESIHRKVLELIEKDFGDAAHGTCCIVIKVGNIDGGTEIRRIYKSFDDFKSRSMDYIKKLDGSRKIDFEIYKFD